MRRSVLVFGNPRRAPAERDFAELKEDVAVGAFTQTTTGVMTNPERVG